MKSDFSLKLVRQTETEVPHVSSHLQFLQHVATEVGVGLSRSVTTVVNKEIKLFVLGELYPIHTTIRKLSHNEKSTERQSRTY